MSSFISTLSLCLVHNTVDIGTASFPRRVLFMAAAGAVFLRSLDSLKYGGTSAMLDDILLDVLL